MEISWKSGAGSTSGRSPQCCWIGFLVTSVSLVRFYGRCTLWVWRYTGHRARVTRLCYEITFDMLRCVMNLWYEFPDVCDGVWHTGRDPLACSNIQEAEWCLWCFCMRGGWKGFCNGWTGRFASSDTVSICQGYPLPLSRVIGQSGWLGNLTEDCHHIIFMLGITLTINENLTKSQQFNQQSAVGVFMLWLPRLRII